MSRMQQYLEKAFGKFFSLEQLDKEIGNVMEQITSIMIQFMQLGIRQKELATLQVILLLSSGKVSAISIYWFPSVVHLLLQLL